MKLRFFLLVIWAVCVFPALSQHLIVTTEFDSLNCKIEKLKDNQYLITFMLDGEVTSGYIHQDQILHMEKNVFKNYKNNTLRSWYPIMDVGLDGGIIHQPGVFRIDDDLTDKSDFRARTGIILGTDITFFISHRIGYGLKYNFRSLLGGDINYHYVGPMMVFRFWENNKMNTFRYRNINKTNHFFFSFSGGFGWMVQKNAPVQLDLIRPRIEMFATAISGEVTAGYHFRFTNKVSARIKTSYNVGYPNFVKIRDIQKYVRPSDQALDIGDYCHNMNTLNLSVGLTFHN